MRITELAKFDVNRYRPFLFPASGYPQPAITDGIGDGGVRTSKEVATNLWVCITGLYHRIAVAPGHTNYIYECNGNIECNQTGFPAGSWPIAMALTNEVMVTHLEDVREV